MSEERHLAAETVLPDLQGFAILRRVVVDHQIQSAFALPAQVLLGHQVAVSKGAPPLGSHILMPPVSEWRQRHLHSQNSTGAEEE